MMTMKRSSASCNALTDLNRSPRSPRNSQTLHSVCESTPCLHDLEPTALHVDDEPLFLPKNASTCSLDEYLSSIPRVASRSKELLMEASIHELRDEVRCLNVLQGEMAHASADQADVVVSSEATTCHIVALRSTNASQVDISPLVSLTHVDRAGYDNCLEKMVKEHVRYHRLSLQREGNIDPKEDGYGFFMDENAMEEDSRTNDSDAGMEVVMKEPQERIIDMELHMLGGFLDKEGKSQELSTSLLKSFSKLSKRYEHVVKMHISTAAISCMNSCQVSKSPLGRGMGIYTASGRVFVLNSVPSHVAGPALEVRNARVFQDAPESEERLSVIHDVTSRGELRIEPFVYQHVKQMELLADLPDKILLKYVSTSPEHEGPEFCDNIRSTFQFMKRVPSCHVFGSLSNEPLRFKRSKSGNSLNAWALSS